MILRGQSARFFNCPLCRKQCSFLNVTRVKFIDRQINQLSVKCPNSCNAQKVQLQSDESDNCSQNNEGNENESSCGQKRDRPSDIEEPQSNKRRRLSEDELCEWTGCYSDLKDHIKSCPFQIVSCGHCGLSMKRKEVNGHYDECPSFPIQCTECKETEIMRSEMESHIRDKCPRTIIECTECKQKIRRYFEMGHLQIHCPEVFIKCSFKKLGCKQQFKRKDEKKHLEENAIDHMSKMAANQIKLEKKIKTLEATVERLKKGHYDNDNDSTTSGEDKSESDSDE